MKIKDIEYQGHALREAPFKEFMPVNNGEYYMVCNKCSSNNLVHDNWYESKVLDTILKIRCEDCGNIESLEDMYIIKRRS